MKAYIFVLALFLLSPALVESPSAVDHSAYQSADECIVCHRILLPSHKLGQPSKMSDQFPLDPSGKMSCLTCHDCVLGTCVLRKSSPELCRVCHDCSQGMACLIGTPHLGNSPRISDIVGDCLSCHDGTVGKSAGMPGGHKLDVLYIRGKNFNSVTDKQIVFVDGRVTCVSCHNPYGSDPAKLSKSNEGSLLCLTCHRK
ncbi:MAG: hypothetical protein HZA17_06670 [Nitrospirae bacterium]|nr:hypothetical protein [Nitrospirota bacterium]